MFAALRRTALILDRDGCVLAANPAAKRMFGAQLSQAGRHGPHLDALFEGPRDGLARDLRAGASLGSITLTQKGVSGKEPRTRRFQVSGLRGDAGQNNQFLMVETRAEQVSGKFHALNRQLHIANKRVEMQRRTLEELSSSYEELDRFSAFAAHDLQAPLRGISNWLRFLREDFVHLLPPDGVECVEMAEGSANRLGALIASLLTLSRSDRAEMHRTDVSLPTLIGEVTTSLAADIADAGARVISGTGLGTLKADRDLLLLLLQNLIGNALRYRNPDRAPVVRITRTATEDGGEEIAVIDNGRGFENGYAEQILKPFQRLYSASEIPGSGIGLAICANICDRHGWQLSAAGVPDVGATFRISMPAARQSDREAAARAPNASCVPRQPRRDASRPIRP